jgi:hypothetical protein
MTEVLSESLEHLTQVFEDHGVTEHVWWFWRCSCGAGRRADWDGVYGSWAVAQARADGHTADLAGGAR